MYGLSMKARYDTEEFTRQDAPRLTAGDLENIEGRYSSPAAKVAGEIAMETSQYKQPKLALFKALEMNLRLVRELPEVLEVRAEPSMMTVCIR